MKRYHKIWVPEKINHPSGQMHYSDRDGDTPVLKKENVIVLTIEEALEMWNAGRHRQSDEFKSENLSKVTAPDFYNYLKSKGITI